MSKGFLFELSRQAYEAQRRERASPPRLLEHLCPDGAARLRSIADLREMRADIRQVIDQLHAEGKTTVAEDQLLHRTTKSYRAALRDWIREQRRRDS